MLRILKVFVFVSVTGTVILSLLYQRTSAGTALALAITFGTVAYHFVMRLLVAYGFNSVMHNKADYTKRRYQIGKWEQRIYEILRVKKWKNKMPTYNADFFNPNLHTWSEIAQAMCQAELVHETIVVLSFLPIFAGRWFGAYPVFIITSVLAALFDLLFVIMQRYNRGRIAKILKYKK